MSAESWGTQIWINESIRIREVNIIYEAAIKHFDVRPSIILIVDRRTSQIRNFILRDEGVVYRHFFLFLNFIQIFKLTCRSV